MGHIFLASRSDTNEIVDYTECTGENDEYYPLSPINRIETCEISASAPIGVYTQVSILSTFFQNHGYSARSLILLYRYLLFV